MQLLHQPDPRFIFGILVLRSNLYFYFFTSVGVISSEPFNMLKDPNTLQILIRGLSHLPAEKRGGDVNFRRVYNSSQPDRYQRILHFKTAPTKTVQTKRVEESGAQRLVKTTAGEVAGAGHAAPREKFPREKYSPGRVWGKIDNAAGCESSPLYLDLCIAAPHYSEDGPKCGY